VVYKKQELLTLPEYLGSPLILSLKQFGGGGVPIVHIFSFTRIVWVLFFVFVLFEVFCFCFVFFCLFGFFLRFVSYSQTLLVSLDVPLLTLFLNFY